MPLIVAIIVPVELLWEVIGLLTDRDLKKTKTIIYGLISNRQLIALFLGVILSVILLVIIRYFNKDNMYNKGSMYHNYSIRYFVLAGKVLGYKRVSLVMVPLYLQFEIVFKDLFDEVLIDDHAEKDDNPQVTILNKERKSNEINLILSDTYKINLKDIPINKRDLPSILIERGTDFSGVRTYNSKFTDIIREQTNKYRFNYERVNIFATTNTKHTKEIILQSFKNGGRTGFEEIYVFEQNEEYKFDNEHEIT